jgi:hypothetical protein
MLQLPLTQAYAPHVDAPKAFSQFGRRHVPARQTSPDRQSPLKEQATRQPRPFGAQRYSPHVPSVPGEQSSGVMVTVHVALTQVAPEPQSLSELRAPVAARQCWSGAQTSLLAQSELDLHGQASGVLTKFKQPLGAKSAKASRTRVSGSHEFVRACISSAP